MSGNIKPRPDELFNVGAMAHVNSLRNQEHPPNDQPTSIISNETVAKVAKPPPKGEKLPKEIAAISVNAEARNSHDNPREDSNTPEVPNQKNDNSSLDQQRKSSSLVLGLVAIVALFILLLLLSALLGLVTFSSLAATGSVRQEEALSEVSKTVCNKYKDVKSDMSDSTGRVLGTMEYECREMPTSGTSEHTSAETNPYALVKDTCWVHFYDPDTGKKNEGVQLASGYLYFSVCGVKNLPWNFFNSVVKAMAKHVWNNYVKPVQEQVRETVETLYKLVVKRSETKFNYYVIPFSHQHWCFQLAFASVFVAPIIIKKWLCWDKRRFSSKYGIFWWVCDLLLCLYGCWCLGSACYGWVGNASMNALQQRIEADTTEVANMIDLTMLNKLQFENGTLTKEAFRSASVRKDDKSSELLDKAFAQFAGSKDASILNREQVTNFTQYVKVIKLQTQWSPANTWNWLWSEDFKDGVCNFVNDSMEWVVKNVVFFFWGCFLTNMVSGGFQIFNKFAKGTQNANLQGLTQASHLLFNSVSGSTQTTLDVALKVAAQLGPMLKIVVWSATVVFAMLAFYMAGRTGYDLTMFFLYDVIATTPQWWCVYHYIDGFVFALCKQYCYCTLLHEDSKETLAIAEVDKDRKILDKNIGNTKQGASDKAMRNRIEKFAFLHLCSNYGLLKMPKQAILQSYFLSFVFEALEMLETDESEFNRVENVAISKFKSDVQKKAFKRSDVNKNKTLQNIFTDLTIDLACQVKTETYGRKTGKTVVEEARLVDLKLKESPFVMKMDHVDPKVRSALEESGVVNPHWARVDYLQYLLAMFQELKQINGNEDVNNNYLWSNFGQHWSKRVEELASIIYT